MSTQETNHLPLSVCLPLSPPTHTHTILFGYFKPECPLLLLPATVSTSLPFFECGLKSLAFKKFDYVKFACGEIKFIHRFTIFVPDCCCRVATPPPSPHFTSSLPPACLFMPFFLLLLLLCRRCLAFSFFMTAFPHFRHQAEKQRKTTRTT